MAAAGGSISPTHQRAITAFCLGVKADGVWPLVDFIWPCAGDQLAAALVPLKCAPSRAAPAAMTNVGFTAGDYTPTGGLVGDGTAKYLDTRHVPSTALGRTPWGAHLGVFTLNLGIYPNSRAVDSGAPGYEIGVFQNLNPLFPQGVYSGFYGASQAYTYGNMSTLSPGQSAAPCLRLLTSDGANSRAYIDGRIVKTIAVPGHFLPTTRSVYLFAYNSNGTPSSYSYATLAGATLGAWLTPAQAVAYSARWYTLQTAFGRTSLGLSGATVHPLLLWAQSLGEGYLAAPVRTGKVAGGHVAYMGGGRIQAGAAEEKLDRLYPLGETFPTASGNYAETPVSGACAQYTALGGARRFFCGGYPIGGTAYTGLKKGTTPYNNALAAHQQAAKLVTAAGGTMDVLKWCMVVHGETDDANNNASYATNLQELWTDLDADYGTSGALKFVFVSPASWTKMTPNKSTPSQTILDFLALYKLNPDRYVLAGPGYVDSHVDGVHMTGGGARWRGERIGKAMAAAESGTFIPLYPLSVTRSGADITVVFSRGGLAFDTTTVSDPAGSYASRKYGTGPGSATDTTVVNKLGFEFVDDGAPGATPTADVAGFNGQGLVVANINANFGTTTIAGDTLTVNLSGSPTGTNKRLRYAFTMTSGNNGGPTTGARGCLRDADASATSLYGNTLYNWCVTFDEAAT